MANVDYTKALQDYKNSQLLGQRALRRYRNAGPGTALATALSGYFAGQGMRGAQGRMGDADKADQDANNMAMSQALGAFRGDTTATPNPADVESGLGSNYTQEGTGQNVNAMAQSLMGSGRDGYDKLGLAMLAREQKPEKGTSLMRNLVAAGYTPGTQEYNEAMRAAIEKTDSTTIKMPPIASAPAPGYQNVYTEGENPQLLRQDVTPGGPVDVANKKAALEAAQAQEKAVQQQQQTRVKNTEFLSQIDKAIENNTFFTTGMLGKIMSYWPGSDANFQSKLLERIQGEVALNRLAQAQAASKTGGVFGSLQKAELDLLKNSLEALEVGMTQEQMEKGLNGIKEHRLKWEGYQTFWDVEGNGLTPEAKKRNFGGFGRYLPDEGGVEILDEANYKAYEIEARTGIKQNYKRIGVYQ